MVLRIGWRDLVVVDEEEYEVHRVAAYGSHTRGLRHFERDKENSPERKDGRLSGA